MKLNSDIQDIPWKKVLVVGVILLVIGGIAFGAWTSLDKKNQKTLSSETSKGDVTSYLKDRAGVSEFKPVTEVTNKRNPWDTLKAQYDAPPDYKTVYRNIGEHLVIAEQLMNADSYRDQVLGLRLVTDLCEVAMSVAVDPWLSARICDTYLMPNIDKVEEKPRNGPSQEQFMSMARRIYKDAEETDRLIELGKAYLAKNPSADRADKVRWSLARELEQKGDNKGALKYLRDITHSSFTNEANRRITIVEQRLKATGK